jgi:transcriptional regulator with XRE-family HTH domain
MDRKLTQRQVANAIGVRQTSICDWETGKLAPSVACLPGIFRFLGYDPRPTPDTFGQRLVHLRETHGLSQRALAKLLRSDPLTLRRWENDQHQPTRKLL